MEEGKEECKGCSCFCHKVIGLLIALFGLTFLLKDVGVYGDYVNNIVWPSLILLGGLKKMFGGMCGCCDNS